MIVGDLDLANRQIGWMSLSSELDRAYQEVMDVTQIYFAATFVGEEQGQNCPKYFVAGHSGGELRLFLTDSVMGDVDSDDVEPVLSIKAHKHGPIYNLAKMRTDDDTLLLSCGDDGSICGWSWREMESAASDRMAGSSQRVGACEISPQFELKAQKPDKSNEESEVNAIAVDEHNGRFFAGDGNGSWHMWDLNRAPSSSPDLSMHGHSAMLLDLEYNARTGLLATSSEDGTACIWDCRNRSCLTALDPSEGVRLPIENKENYLSYWKHRYCPCVTFDPDGSWLMCGSSEKMVTFWNIRADMAVRQVQTQAVPHAIAAGSNELYIVGEEAFLNRYTYRGGIVSRTDIAPEVTYSVEVDPTTQAVLLSGSESTVQITTQTGESLGKVSSRRMLDTVASGAEEITLFSDSDTHTIDGGW